MELLRGRAGAVDAGGGAGYQAKEPVQCGEGVLGRAGLCGERGFLVLRIFRRASSTGLCNIIGSSAGYV